MRLVGLAGKKDIVFPALNPQCPHPSVKRVRPKRSRPTPERLKCPYRNTLPSSVPKTDAPDYSSPMAMKDCRRLDSEIAASPGKHAPKVLPGLSPQDVPRSGRSFGKRISLPCVVPSIQKGTTLKLMPLKPVLPMINQFMPFSRRFQTNPHTPWRL